MTRYDPFAYGEVRLDPNTQQGGAPSDAEDLLFASGESVKQAPPADSSWSLLDEDVDDLLPSASSARAAAEFGAEILGEQDAMSLADLDDALPGSQQLSGMMGDTNSGYEADDDDALAGFVASKPRPQPQPQPQESAVPQPEPVLAPAEGEAVAQPRKRREVRRRPLPVEAVAAALPVPAAPSKKKAPGMRRRRPALAALLPLALCAGGGTAASWFWVMQSNPVMAGILGAGTLVAALFTWLFLRG